MEIIRLVGRCDRDVDLREVFGVARGGEGAGFEHAETGHLHVGILGGGLLERLGEREGFGRAETHVERQNGEGSHVSAFLEVYKGVDAEA